MTKKTYEIIEEINEEARKDLNGYSDLVSKLLFHRGIKTNEESAKFIEADYESDLHDPFLMKDLEKAATRILEAIEKNQKICIYSDYDADGVPGAVVLHDFFKKLGFKNFFVYIPHRNLEGFGLNNDAIKEIAEKETKLIITIDCGIADLEQIEFATEQGIETIVTDHHEAAHGIPNAYAVVDPMRDDCDYPYKYLCGAGVIFKVVQGMIKKIENDPQLAKKFNLKPGTEKWLLDMVGVATLSDMVPLTGENRIFAKYGLIVLRKSPRKGLMKLISKGFAKQSALIEEDVVFSITPKINAASRMGNPDTAFQMLSTTDDIEANETVAHLEKINQERKGVVSGMAKEINKFVEENLMEHDELKVPVIVKGNPKWSPSLLGLAASSVVDKYNCPVFLWGRGEGDELKGSCRSDGSVSVVSVMQNLPDGILATFGGHFMAGGFVLNFEKVEQLEDAIVDSYQKSKKGETNLFHKILDAKLQIGDLNFTLYNDIQKLAPFGIGNPKPIFIFENVPIEKFEYFGKEKNHGKFIFKKEAANSNGNSGNFGGNNSNGETIEAIKFFMHKNSTAPEPEFKSGDKITFSAGLEKSTYGRGGLRLKIEDIY